jgi:hypothetical protein
VLGLALAAAAAAPAGSAAQGAADPRVGLGAGWYTPGTAIRNLRIVAHADRPAGFFAPAAAGDMNFGNTDAAFRGDLAFVGSYNGFQTWDVSDPTAPRLRASFVCPGGQGDVSVHGNLLFMSVEQTRGRVDCGGQGVTDTVSAERFRGLRIFDISNLDQPRQVAAVQTCRGSHTHTLVPDPRDAGQVYVYVSGTGVSRSGAELAGCSGPAPATDPNTSYFRIEVIRVPLAAPQDARIVSQPRIFADPQTGNLGGLWAGGSHGPGTQTTSVTNQCHDITAYPEIGLAAGACSGNGILLDIRDPANPVRVEEVTDPAFAYWHSATFNNAGTTVLFTDEWGGGSAPRCRASDRSEWGANALYTLAGRELTARSHYKLPAAQSDTENCVAHNGSLVPVPGRDIMVQAWYQGGISVFDFTDPAKPVEIAYFDRGPMHPKELMTAGFWSAYWYNGHIYGTEISRGLDVFTLLPSEHLTQNEIDAAKLVRMDVFNPQHQTKVTWPASFVVARAYVDQLARGGLAADRVAGLRRELAAAERMGGAGRRAALTRIASRLDGEAAASSDAARVRMLAGALRDLAGAAR